MEKICLDFETALDFLWGDPATIEKLKYYADREEICITSLTLMHLLETVNKPDVVAAFAGNGDDVGLDGRRQLEAARGGAIDDIRVQAERIERDAVGCRRRRGGWGNRAVGSRLSRRRTPGRRGRW